MRVLVFGTFDCLHEGHHFLLREAQKHGDLFVVVARDTTVRRIKGFRPNQSQEERMEAIVSSHPHVTVLLGDRKDYLAPVRKLQPDLILLGYDQVLPPGLREKDFSCPIERLEAYEPERYKSSLLRG